MRRMIILVVILIVCSALNLKAAIETFDQYGVTFPYDNSIWSIEHSTKPALSQIKLSDKNFSMILIYIFNKKVEPSKVLELMDESFRKKFENLQIKPSSGSLFGKTGKAKEYIITKQNLVFKGKDIVVQVGDKTYSVYYHYLKRYSSQELPKINSIINSLKVSSSKFGAQSGQPRSSASEGGFTLPGEQSSSSSQTPGTTQTFPSSGLKTYNTPYFSFNYSSDWHIRDNSGKGRVGATCENTKGSKVIIHFYLVPLETEDVLQEYTKAMKNKFPQLSPQKSTMTFQGEVLPAILYEYSGDQGKLTIKTWAKKYGQYTLLMSYLYTGNTKDSSIDVIVNSFKVKSQ